MHGRIRSCSCSEVNFGFGFDYGEDGDVGARGGVEGAPGVVEGIGYGGEDDGALAGADEEEFLFAVNETRCSGEWQVWLGLSRLYC